MQFFKVRLLKSLVALSPFHFSTNDLMLPLSRGSSEFVFASRLPFFILCPTFFIPLTNPASIHGLHNSVLSPLVLSAPFNYPGMAN